MTHQAVCGPAAINIALSLFTRVDVVSRWVDGDGRYILQRDQIKILATEVTEWTLKMYDRLWNPTILG